VVDIARPRSPSQLQETRGTTALPVLETAHGRVLTEGLVILQDLEDSFPQGTVTQGDPYRRAVEDLLARREGALAHQG
jgi:glutathione S-transferase